MLDPCEDENEDIQDDEMSLGADSVQKDDSSDSDSEVNRQCYSIFCVFISLWIEDTTKAWMELTWFSCTGTEIKLKKSLIFCLFLSGQPFWRKSIYSCTSW